MNCTLCNAETKNKKFCSISCANSFNNSINPKRKANKRACRICKKKLHPKEIIKERCPQCLDQFFKDKDKFLNLTLDELKEKYRESGIHRSWWYSEIRQLARNSKRNKQQICGICGYSKHVECAHIIAISKTTGSTTVREINDDKNVILLCPNCHWEFDNGSLQIRNP